MAQPARDVLQEGLLDLDQLTRLAVRHIQRLADYETTSGYLTRLTAMHVMRLLATHEEARTTE